jgi:hypothetical protein
VSLRRRLSDRLRAAADRLWDEGDKDAADRVQGAARLEEARRRSHGRRLVKARPDELERWTP